ncbi:hypothetical protein Tco_0921691 [Tanacetum coccineum]
MSCTKARNKLKSVNKEVHNKLLKSFAKLENHSISLELSLQQCKEQMKRTNPVCKEMLNVFRKEREQYHEIQDLKAQMQDKNMVISELKKLIENCKGKSVETQFNKPSVVRQPNAQTHIQNHHNLPQIRKQAVRNTNEIAPGPSRNCPKAMCHISARREKITNTANGLQNQNLGMAASMSILVSNKECSPLGEHRKQKPFLKFNDLQYKDAKSHKTTKRYMPVEKSSASKKPERQIPTGHRFSHKKTTTVPEKTRTPRSCLRWQPTGRILKTDVLRWVYLQESLFKLLHEQGTSFNGQKQQRIDLNADALYNEKQENLRVWPRSSMFSRHLIAADQASVFMAMMSVHINSGLVLHQMTSDHNRSELGIQDHSNEPSSSKLVPKVVPLAVKTGTSRQELELLFHLHIAMLRTTGVSNGRHGSQAVFKTSYAYILHDMCQKIRVILSIHNEDGIPA